MSSKTCRKCSAVIPSGRNYCTPHYQQALQEYEEALAQYEADYQQYLINVENWNNMSVEEQNLHHDAAEDSTLSSISGFTALVIGGVIWFMTKDQWEWWIPAGITAVLLGVFLLLKSFLGRVIRGLFFGAFWAIGLVGCVAGARWLLVEKIEVAWVIQLTQQMSTSMNITILAVLAALGLIIGMLREISGEHHAYGGPVAPSRPSAPTP